MKDVKKSDSNSGPHDQKSNTLTTRLRDCSCRIDGKSLVFMHYLFNLRLLMYTVAGPDPNPRGGGQLPNPKSAILR